MTRTRPPLDPLAVAAVATLSAGPHAPAELFAAVDALARRLIGHRLCTVMCLHPQAHEVERLHSSDPASYPPGGRKHKAGTAWGAAVLERGEVFLCRDEADIRRHFDDHALILGLGLGSMMNVPIGFGGRVLGTLNLSHEPGWFGPEDVPAGRVLAALLAPELLAMEH